MKQSQAKLPKSVIWFLAYIFYTIVYFLLSTLSGAQLAGWFNLAVQIFCYAGQFYYGIILFEKSNGLPRLVSLSISLAAICGLIVDCNYNYLVNIRGIDTNSSFGGALLYHIFWTLFLLLWNLAWGISLYNLIASDRKINFEKKISLVSLAVGIAGIFIIFYSAFLPFATMGSLSRAFHTVFASLEATGLYLCLSVLLFRPVRPIMCLSVAFAIMIGHEFVFQSEEILCLKQPLAGLELTWTLSLALTYIGLSNQIQTHAKDDSLSDTEVLPISATRLVSILSTFLICPIVLFINISLAFVRWSRGLYIDNGAQIISLSNNEFYDGRAGDAIRTILFRYVLCFMISLLAILLVSLNLGARRIGRLLDRP